ncbi:MAG: Serine/threonine-protein kinase PknD [Phycisphaerae bacterium]|nr:Serine/threonine-protein kinase PknD [Phycisphaerae bacterium]
MQQDRDERPLTDASGPELPEAFGFHLPADRWVDHLRSAGVVADAGRPDAGSLYVAGERIGPYELLERIGAGGMGAVWKARRVDGQFAQTVAIKLIKRGMDSEEILRRFRLEREILARLEHPGIARLMDGGSTSDGRPFLVMEHIDGRPIDRYCAERAVSRETILTLMRAVCEAVQFAHANLVLHRDIKPANVLITRDGAVKLLDFGIAKLLEDGGDPLTLSARHPALTPRYASPEQLRGHTLSTASDVYSLGVLMYELLSGAWPYGDPTGGLRELERAVCERDPVRLSQVLVRSGRSSGDRGRFLADLDNITLRCLEKDPSRRYASAGELAADIERHLRNEPIHAGPPDLGYRTRKFLRRNAVWVGSAAVIILALVLATSVSVSYALSEARQRKDADEATRKAKVQECLAADRATEAALQSEIAESVAAFLNEDMLASIAPSTEPGQGREVLLREVLDIASLRIDSACLPGGRFFEKPLVEARIRETLADAYASLSEYDTAEPHALRALELRCSRQGEQAIETLQARSRLGMIFASQSRLEEAEPLLREARVGLSKLLGERAPETLAAAENLGVWLQRAGRYEQALEYFTSASAGFCELYGAHHAATRSATSRLGMMLQTLGRFEEATPHLQSALDAAVALHGAESLPAMNARHNLGTLLEALGRYDDALPLLREAVDGKLVVCGADHADTLRARQDLADLLKKMGRYADALTEYEIALDGRRRMLGEEHVDTLTSMRGVASALQYLERFAEAEPHMRRSLELSRAQLGEDHPETLDALSSLASLLVSMKRVEDAEPLARESTDRRRVTLGEDHPSTLEAASNLAAILRMLGRFDEAELLVRDTLERRRRTLGDDHPSTLYSLNTLGVLLINMKRFDEAEPYVKETYARRRDSLGEEHPTTLNARMNLAGLYDMANRPEPALEHHLPILETRRRTLGPDHSDTIKSCSIVAGLLVKLGRPREAEPYAADAVAAARRTLPEGDPATGVYLVSHGKILAELSRFTEAQDALLEGHRMLAAAAGVADKRTLAAREALFKLYSAWATAEPGAGYDEQARRWSPEATAASSRP